MSSPPSQSPAQQLVVTGLCGETIAVEWRHDSTVACIKELAYTAASRALLADGTTGSLVEGVVLDQLCLVCEKHGDSKKLEDKRVLLDCLREICRSGPSRTHMP